MTCTFFYVAKTNSFQFTVSYVFAQDSGVTPKQYVFTIPPTNDQNTSSYQDIDLPFYDVTTGTVKTKVLSCRLVLSTRKFIDLFNESGTKSFIDSFGDLKNVVFPSVNTDDGLQVILGDDAMFPFIAYLATETTDTNLRFFVNDNLDILNRVDNSKNETFNFVIDKTTVNSLFASQDIANATVIQTSIGFVYFPAQPKSVYTNTDQVPSLPLVGGSFSRVSITGTPSSTVKNNDVLRIVFQGFGPSYMKGQWVNRDDQPAWVQETSLVPDTNEYLFRLTTVNDTSAVLLPGTSFTLFNIGKNQYIGFNQTSDGQTNIFSWTSDKSKAVALQVVPDGTTDTVVYGADITLTVKKGGIVYAVDEGIYFQFNTLGVVDSTSTFHFTSI
jgi:hypothetical protein